MLRQTFEQKQQRLRDDVLILGSHVEEVLTDTITAFKHRDLDQAMHLIANGRTISRKCTAIEANTLALFATQQPMASDLRFLATVLEVALELERIGDHGKEIAAINLKLGEETLLDPFSHIVRMARAAGNMLHLSLEAFAKQELALAQCVPAQDDEVDELYERVYQQLMALIRTDQNAIVQAVYLSQVAHHLERVADRTTNICEWVVFAITGVMKELNDQNP